MNEPEMNEPHVEPREPWSGTSDSSGPSSTPNPLEGLRRLALAGIGAVTVATDVTDEVFSELVKRGEQTRQEAMKELNEARERRAERRADTSTYVRARMDAVMNRLNLPSKGDVDAINAKLNILTRKVDNVQTEGVPSGDEAASGGRETSVEEPPI